MKHEDVFTEVYDDLVANSGFPVVADGVSYEPNNATFLTMGWKPAGAVLLNGCSNTHAYKWLCFINIHQPEGLPLADALAVADGLVVQYPAARKFTLPSGGIFYTAKELEVHGALAAGKGWLVLPTTLTLVN